MAKQRRKMETQTQIPNKKPKGMGKNEERRG
jgi:hypothetical protein